MKKFILGTIVGAAAAAVGYKLYKDNEEEVKSFLSEHFDDEYDIDIEDLDVDELEELREYVDEIIDSKDADSDNENISSTDDSYIYIDQLSPEK